MKKINNYYGSVANDIELLQNGSSTPKKFVIASAVTAVGALGLLPFIGGVASAVALGTSIVSLLAAGVSHYRNGKKAEDAEDRFYTLLDSMGVDEKVSEADAIVFEVDMAVQNLKKFEMRKGKYICIKDDNSNQYIIREYEDLSQERTAYVQFLLQLEKEVDNKLALSELGPCSRVITLKR